MNSRSRVGAVIAIFLTLAHARADWSAYNDFSWATGQPNSNITTNSPVGVTNGFLIDYASGQSLSAELQIAGPAATFGAPLGANPVPAGSDADQVFGSAINGDGFVYMGTSGSLFFTIRNLNPTSRYDIILYSSRQATSDTYDNRWTEIQLSDCGASFTNASSTGVQILQTGGLANDTSRISAGNTNGMIVKFVGIDPGNDQDIDINIKGYATAGYSTNSYLNAIKVIAHGEAAPVVQDMTTRYFKGTQEASTPVNLWRNSDFDAGQWSSATVPLWYGDASSGTLLADMSSNYPTVFLRIPFNLTNLPDVSGVSLTVDFDDGFMAWVNGNEIAASNAPANPLYTDQATASHEASIGGSGASAPVTFTIPMNLLTAGRNVLAVQGFNFGLQSSDFHLNPSITIHRYSTSTNFEAYSCTITNGQMRPTWRVQAGRKYTIKYKNKISDPSWTVYTTNLAPSTTAYAVSLPMDQPCRYFQMFEEPQVTPPGGSGGSDSNRYFMIWPQYMSDVTVDGTGPLVTTGTVDSFTRTIRSAKAAGANAVVINNLSWETAMKTRNGAKDWAELEYYLWRVNQEGMKAVLTFGWWRQCKHKPQTLPNSLFITGHGSRDAEWRSISTNCTEFWTDHQVMHNGTNTLEPGMNMCVGSFSSPATVLSMSNYLSSMADYIWNQSPYGSNVIAIMPSYGNNGEARDFIGWDDPNPNGNLWANDYSAAAQSGFRTWLQTKYGTIGALNTAWGSGYGSFSAVSAPMPNTWSWGLSYNNDGQGRDWVAYGAYVIRNMCTSLRNGMRAVAPQSRFAMGAKDLKGTYMYAGHVGNLEYVMQPADYIISYAGIANQMDNSLGHEDNREFLIDVIKGTFPSNGVGQAMDHRDLSGDSTLLQRTSAMTFNRGGQFFMLWLRWSDAAWIESNKTMIQNAVSAANLGQPVATRTPTATTSFTFQQQYQDADISANWRSLSVNGNNIVNVQQQNNGSN